MSYRARIHQFGGGGGNCTQIRKIWMVSSASLVLLVGVSVVKTLRLDRFFLAKQTPWKKVKNHGGGVNRACKCTKRTINLIPLNTLKTQTLGWSSRQHKPPPGNLDGSRGAPAGRQKKGETERKKKKLLLSRRDGRAFLGIHVVALPTGGA